MILATPLAERVIAGMSAGERALIVTGAIGAGKTAAVFSLGEELRARGLVVGGVTSPRVLVGTSTVGYRVRDVATGEERVLCRDEPPGIPFRRFFFSSDGLAFANDALYRAAEWADVVIVDEVGPLELSGGGFAPGIRTALASQVFLILTVRPSLVAEARTWAHLPTITPVWTISEPYDTGER